MKELFESNIVGKDIHQWYDLIFGYKQTGEAAVEARNIYPAITYENGIDMEHPDNQSIKHSLIVQAYNYGQCPTQLFNEPHVNKEIPKTPLQFIDPSAYLQSKSFDVLKNKYRKITE